MIATPESLIGLAAAAFVIASLSPDVAGLQGTMASQAAAPVSIKGDRMAAPVTSRNPSIVTSVELIGVSGTTVILRDRNGVVLYRSDPLTNTTLVSKNTDLPVITLKEGGAGPVVQQPLPSPTAGEAPSAGEGRQTPPPEGRKNPAGCEGPLSPLVKHGVTRVPGLCVVQLDRNRIT